MKLSTLLIFSFPFLLGTIVIADERPDHRCGSSVGNPPCAPGRCCSIFGWCGGGPSYCSGSNCQYSCSNGARSTDLPRALLRPTNNLNDISKMISESLFNEMFKHRKDCPSRGFYSYEAFITAARSFPGFCTSGDVATRKRELAAFLSQTSQATTGQRFDSVVVDPHAWGYCHINGTTNGNENERYCTSSNWPCASGKKYNSRGPIQLTHNYNYGLAGEAIGIDLVNDPDLVATDPIVSFKTAIWFWMTQHDNNPSLHDILINANYEASDQVPSYGVLSNIINSNSGHKSGLDIITTSIGYYKRYCDMLEVSYGDNLKNWFDETPFSKVARIKMHVV
uniref:Hevein-like protein n=1 Tax=Sambucus nigra TaxID=4202 RepID=Q944B8_SAMNI|nr:hevein-like protein [Sambucus nigra]